MELKIEIKNIVHSLWGSNSDGRIGFYRGYAFVNLLHEQKYKTMYSGYHFDEQAALENLLVRLKKTQDMVSQDASFDPYQSMIK